MATPSTTGAPPKPTHGSRCPVCNNGVLYLIAVSDAGEYLWCFNCNTGDTIPREGEWQHLTSADPQNEAPTGFRLRPAQLEAKREAGVEPYGSHDHPAFAGAAPAQPAEPAAPHDQHDVVPPGEPQQQGGGSNG